MTYIKSTTLLNEKTHPRQYVSSKFIYINAKISGYSNKIKKRACK